MATHSATTEYSVIRATRRTDPHAFWRGNELVIVVQADELTQFRLSQEDQLDCQALAAQKRLPLETVILNRKLSRAGAKKFQQLRELNLLPPYPGQVPTAGTSRGETTKVGSGEHNLEEEADPETENESIENITTTSEEGEYQDSQTEDPRVQGPQGQVPDANRNVPLGHDNNMETVPTATAQAIKLAKADIDEIEARVANITLAPMDMDEVTHYRSTLEESEKELRAGFNTVYAIVDLPEDILTDHINQQGTYHTKVKSVKLELTKIAGKLAPVPQQGPQGNTPPARKGLALPKCELPKFSGHWKEWISFKDVMNSTVIKLADTELPAVHKFQLLRQSLRGEALQLIQSIPMTGDNLDRAWTTLCERYDNTRRLFQNYVRDLDHIKQMSSPSAVQLRATFERINDDREALKALGAEVDHWDELLITKFVACFDPETRNFYEMIVCLTTKGSSQEKIDWGAMREFVNSRCLALENTSSRPREERRGPPFRQSTAMAAQQSSNQDSRPPLNCYICQAPHMLRKCDKFKKMSVEKRSELIRQKKLCAVCFSSNHESSSCTSQFLCGICKKRHNTMLHYGKRPYLEAKPVNPGGVQANTACKDFSPVILPTVQVLVRNSAQELLPCRALLDTGSQSNFISERAAQWLHLKRKRADVQISGIGNGTAACSRGYVDLYIQSAVDPTVTFSTTALILPQVTGDTPGQTLPTGSWRHLQGLQLADPKYGQPGKLDIVLGADVTFKSFTGGSVHGRPDEPIAQSTTFGWVVGGVGSASASSTRVMANLAIHEAIPLSVLQCFWGVEGLSEGTIPPHQTNEDKECEEIFQTTTRRCNDGKLEVSFPFKKDPPDVGASRQIALKRLAGTEARLARNPDLRRQYEEFLTEYETQGHMEEVKMFKPNDVYLPHHPIVRTTVLTTKLRVVFDASAKTANGNSLNSQQIVGPTIQDDLFSILARFRLHKVAINGDIEKMYRQLWIAPQHQDYQRILWRRKPEDPITDFRLKTVTYGTASAPWLATRALKWIAEKETADHPEAARVIAQDFYMDDLVSGADSAEQAHAIQEEVTNLLNSYGLPLRKWASNNEYVIRAITGDQAMLTNPEEIVKTLGLKWNAKMDCFQFKVKLKETTSSTKRAMISEIAATFDPLGFAAPVMVLAKILYQEVWQRSTDWDDNLPQDIDMRYQALRTGLGKLESIIIPRWLGNLQTDDIELHIFSDASEKAYAACVYLRVQGANGTTSNLIASKTRVAPLKTVTLPRLELMGAVLAANLMEQVAKALRRPIERRFYWTDSTITLAWIKSVPTRFKTFVANRIAVIQELTDVADWRHVGTKENPADLASRGIMPDMLKNETLEFWFTGPPWLQRGQMPENTGVPEAQEELKKVQVLHASPKRNVIMELIERKSSYQRLWRIAAWILRFVNNCRTKEKNLESNFSPQEKKMAILKLISVVQQQEWSMEIKALSQAKTTDVDEDAVRIMKRSSISNLNPFLDDQGILRVGGRLQNSKLEFASQHPALLPYGHWTKIYLHHLHIKNLHAGPTLLLATARQQVWIVRGPQAAREAVKKCIECTRWKGVTLHQQMGNLPRARTEGLRAFNTVGVDYAGPIMVKNKKGRCASTSKAWIAVFVCFSTKAVHLELVSELTTAAFIAALRRFVARRGLPREIHSDNGTNFVGSDRELKELLKQQAFQQDVTGAALDEGISWKFIPPSAPHQGGLWESAVKSTKHHLRRVLGASLLTFEEFSTVLCQIEAQLNSRPLCPLNEDTSGLDILTPGHFLIGQPLTNAPDPDLAHLKENRLSRWQYLQRLQQDFWTKWHREYLSSLQKRNKWKHPEDDVTVGSLVLIKEDNLAPTQWRRGRVTSVHPGSDGKIRVVTLKTATGEISRPIVKLIQLI